MVTEQNNDIYIGCSYRIDQDTYEISNEIMYPIRCGAYFDRYNRNRLLGDDTGINISEKRNSYCELTVQYWMWKNIQAEKMNLKYPKGSRLRNSITKILNSESLLGKIFKFDRG